jgi:hypothetical protein
MDTGLILIELVLMTPESGQYFGSKFCVKKLIGPWTWITAISRSCGFGERNAGYKIAPLPLDKSCMQRYTDVAEIHAIER